MKEDEKIINGIGIHSSLGGIVQASAAFRCGFSRGRELHDWPYFDKNILHEHLQIGNPAAGQSDLFQGIGRYIKMGCSALADMKKCLDLTHLDPDRIGAFFVFSQNNSVEPHSVNLKEEFGLFRQRLCALSGVQINESNVRTYFEGSIGFASALRDALASLDQGEMDHCLIGAIDTLLDVRRLYRLLADNRIKTIDNPNGLMPGEAACFILIEPMSRSMHRKNMPIITISPSSGVKFEKIVHRHGNLANSHQTSEHRDIDISQTIDSGVALDNAFRKILKEYHYDQVNKGTIYCDLNGENSRATDFGNALIRISPYYPLVDWKVEIPALSFGDTGAASSMLAACLAVQALNSGHCFGQIALVTISSHESKKSVLGLRKTVNG